MGGEKTTRRDDPSEEYREKLMDFVNRVDEHLNVSEKMEATRQYAAAHPMMTTAGVITLILCSFPLMCFGAFVISTMFFTFLSFLFVEGFLLTIGGVFLGTALVVTGALSLFISLLVAVGFFTFHYGSKLLQSLIRKKQEYLTPGYIKESGDEGREKTTAGLMQDEE